MDKNRRIEIDALGSEELFTSIRAIIRDEVRTIDSQNQFSKTNLLTADDICEALSISKTQFKRISTGLIECGMFQMNGRGSEWRMSRVDLMNYIEKLKQA